MAMPWLPSPHGTCKSSVTSSEQVSAVAQTNSRPWAISFGANIGMLEGGNHLEDPDCWWLLHAFAILGVGGPVFLHSIVWTWCFVHFVLQRSMSNQSQRMSNPQRDENSKHKPWDLGVWFGDTKLAGTPLSVMVTTIVFRVILDPGIPMNPSLFTVTQGDDPKILHNMVWMIRYSCWSCWIPCWCTQEGLGPKKNKIKWRHPRSAKK